MCSIWLALDPVDKGTSVRYWKGSHKLQQQYKVTSFDGGDIYQDCKATPMPDVDAMVERGEIELLAWELQPGTILVHLFTILIYLTTYRSLWSAMHEVSLLLY